MKKRILTSALAIGVIVALLAATAGLAQQAVVNQPVAQTSARPADLPTGDPWVKVRIDEGLFTLFAALNASGYDQEYPRRSYHPVRQLVRRRLAGKHIAGQERLRAELGLGMNTYNFVVWSLHYGPPPDFARLEPGWSEPGIPAFPFLGMDGDLRSFYKEMDIASLWQDVRPQYEQEAARYQKAAGQGIQDILDYVRMQDVPLKQVVVIPNLLSANWLGNGPTVGNTAYVVVGPTDGRPDVSLVQHEALHSIAGPLVEANLSQIDAQRSLALYADLQKRVPPGYGSWEIIVEETVVRAINCRLAGLSCEQYLLKNDEAEGFLLERALVNRLADFEQGSKTLAEFMPDMLRTIDNVPVAAVGNTGG